jgi:hypothetical protein
MINLIWDCTVIIHNEELNDLPNGADWPPRKAAVEAIESLGLSVHSVSSGWGCDESTPKIASLKRRVAMLENECVEKYSRIQQLESGYEELRVAALNAVCKIGGGQAKADLRDAYDKATEYFEALKEQE